MEELKTELAELINIKYQRMALDFRQQLEELAGRLVPPAAAVTPTPEPGPATPTTSGTTGIVSILSFFLAAVFTYSFSLSLQRTTKPPPKKQQTPEQERRLIEELSSASSAEEEEEEGGGGSSSATSAASSDSVEAASEDEAPGKKKKVASSTGPTPSKKIKKQAPPHAAESQPVPPTVPDETGDVLKEYFFPHFLALRTACLALQPRFNPQAWQQTKSAMNHFCAVLGDYGLTTRKDHRLK